MNNIIQLTNVRRGKKSNGHFLNIGACIPNVVYKLENDENICNEQRINEAFDTLFEAIINQQ